MDQAVTVGGILAVGGVGLAVVALLWLCYVVLKIIGSGYHH